jgi:EAL domain-containing protein (putative c-di-GMP-specific phosphodiesterase class I)
MLMAKTDATVEKLEVLRERGVRFAIDDFGTGYSSLSYLQGFPVDILKISKPFIDGVGNGNPEDSALAKAIIKLGVNLNLQTIAEGIESHVQLSHLKDLACPMGQGFLLAEPLNVKDLGDLLGSGSDALKIA